MDRRPVVEGTTKKNSLNIIKEFIQNNDLIDVWRHLHPQEKRYTCHKSVRSASRIDFFLLSFSLLNSVVQTGILTCAISDHSMLFLELQLESEPVGKGLWRLNTKWIGCQEYKELINQAIDEVLIKNQQEKLDPQMAWEMIKNEITGKSIQFSFQQAKEKNAQILDMQEKIQVLENKADALINTDQLQPLFLQINELKQKLNEFEMEKAKITILNTQARWFNEGEKSTKYFLNLQKQCSNEKKMNKIFLDDGTMVTERGRILEETRKFYQKLYTSNSSVKFSLTNESDRVLSDEEKDEADSPLSVQDLSYALNKMSEGKSPGIDGIPPKFYKQFWDKLSLPLLTAFKYAKKTGKLHSSARRGALTLLPKKDRDIYYVKNWRPISLLNTDYKILAKSLANRIKIYLDKLKTSDQTGFMRGRNIATNIRKILDLSDYCDQNNVEACILIADFEKCFDSVEISSVDKILEYFGFGPNIR